VSVVWASVDRRCPGDRAAEPLPWTVGLLRSGLPVWEVPVCRRWSSRRFPYGYLVTT